MNENHDLPFGGMVLKIRIKFFCCIAMVGFEFFGQFSCHADPCFRLQSGEYFQGRWQSMGRLEKKMCLPRCQCGLQCLRAFAFFDREKSAEAEAVARESRADQRVEYRRWSGQYLVGYLILDATLHQSITRIRYSRHACISDDGDFFSLPDPLDELGDAADFIVLVK